MMSPDSEFTVKSMALEMRQVVANFLASPDGNLYVDTFPQENAKLVANEQPPFGYIAMRRVRFQASLRGQLAVIGDDT